MAACAVPPCFFTVCEATHSIQLRSALHLLRIADLTLPIGSLLSLAGYSSSSPLEDIVLARDSIPEGVKKRNYGCALGTAAVKISCAPVRVSFQKGWAKWLSTANP